MIQTTGTATTTNSRPSTKDEHLAFSMISYNCKGFKQSVDAISTMVLEHDIVGLSETWLRPGELPSLKLGISDIHTRSGHGKDNSFCVFAKSAMTEVDSTYRGRPFGGVALLCKPKDDIVYSEIKSSNDRIVAVKVCDRNGNVIHVVINVYMPFFQRGNHLQTEKFIDAIDALQVLLDEYAAIAPIKIIGDFNVKLPSNLTLSPGWYKTRGFTSHSNILYDFMISNDLIAADLIFEQSIDYTFFCDANNTHTWIDHCLSSKRDINKIVDCQIKSLDENLSDHLPIVTTMSFPHASRPSCKSNKTGIKKFPRVKWDNHNNNLLYKLYLEKRLTDLGQLYIASHSTGEVVQEEMDDYMDKLCDVIHSAAEDAGCTNQQKYTPKPYWCPRLSELRDKKRFWWRLWVLNNRPRIGQVYECYKGVKKLFRKSFRQSVSNITDNHFQKLQNMYNKRNMRAFWNEIRNSKQAKVVSSVQPETFKDFYSGIMQESGHTTNIDEQILCDVDSFYVKHSSYHNAHDVSRETINDLIDSMRHNASPGIDGLSAEHLQYGKCDTLCSILASVYSTILSHCYVPTSFTHGVIVPVLKKSTLNPNLAENYRPITISCMLSKIL